MGYHTFQELSIRDSALLLFSKEKGEKGNTAAHTIRRTGRSNL